MNHVYVLVRDDLPSAVKAVQSCHAAIQCGRNSLDPDEIHPSLVLLTVPNEEALRDWSAQLKNDGVEHHVFEEDDLDGQATALATGPIKPDGRRRFRSLKLLA